MTKYKLLPITTKYWKPGQNYVTQIIQAINGKIQDNDIIALSEKAISTAAKNITDESKISATFTARFISAFWMRTIWGYVLGPMCRLKPRLLNQIRHYPKAEGSRHKQVALQQAGLLQALMFGSEGAIDGSNLPYSYVSLPLKNPEKTAETIREEILRRLGKRISVIIVDTDKTYSYRNFHFTPRPTPLKGIKSHGGFLAYVVGRFFKLKKRATPLALSGNHLSVEEVLRIAEISNRSRGYGTGRTVWEMTENFKVGFTEVTWEMLDRAKHKPIVLVRTIEENHVGRKNPSLERLLQPTISSYRRRNQKS